MVHELAEKCPELGVVVGVRLGDGELVAFAGRHRQRRVVGVAHAVLVDGGQDGRLSRQLHGAVDVLDADAHVVLDWSKVFEHKRLVEVGDKPSVPLG